MKIFLWASIIWLLPFLFFVQKNEAKFKKNIVVGVTLPQEARDDAEVQALLKKYVKETGMICILLGLAVIPCWFPKHFNWLLFAWMLWLDLVIVLTQLPFIKCNKKLKALKAQRGWNKKISGQDNTDETITVNMSNITTPKWLSPWVFIGAFILTMVPIFIDQSLWPFVLTFGVTQIMFYVMYRYAFRTKSEAIDSNVELTQALTQVRRSYWGRIWVNIAYSTAIYSLSILLLKTHGSLFLWITIAYSIYTILVVASPEFKIRKVQETLTSGSGTGDYIDDDDHWVWGMFYYNPKDSHALVNGRVGVGSTINVARPFGKFMCIFTVVIMVLMPAFPFMLDMAIDEKVEYVRDERYVTVSCGRSDYKVELEKIEEVKLLNDYPEGLSRTWGTATDEILKGNFSAKDYPPMQVCLNPGKTPYILVLTNNRKAYLFGTEDQSRTMELYELLSAPITGQ